MTILILGATRGLGREIARICRRDGHDTIETGSSLENGREGRRTFLNVDLSSSTSVSALMAQLDALPPVDQFYWVAGRLLKGDFAVQEERAILETMDINVRNVLPLVHYLWQRMGSADSLRRIVAVASSSGKKARSDEAVYAASKFAQVGLIRSLGLENRSDNLKITLVLPGGMKTGLWDRFPNPEYGTFMDPAKVAERIVAFVNAQQERFAELDIPRGSL
ncbi:SDR family oxidoreductase [bacterium]|nr:SDR family oxidoreductase [bacterium]